ncbi:hypothetical protein CBS12448_10830 [Aspergillus niger]|nr:hypothetical protein CBS12448_10830 [Aspergillus niger]
MQAERPFRIVVVGAGVAGLVASNCLQRLGIDHIVLEKHAEVAPPMGNGISMWPHGLRVLHQLGYLPAIQRDAVPVNRFLSRGPDGRVMHDNLLYTLVEKNHGIGFFPLERRNLLQILYDGLPDQSFVRTKAIIENVKQFPDRVEVCLADGRVETGDMVLGCDGVHSLIRSFMWDHATKTSPGLIQVKEKTSLNTNWKTLLVTTPPIPELGEREVNITHNNRFTFLATSQPDAVYVVVVFLLDAPFTWPKRQRFTDEDANALAELVADKPVTDQLLFSEIWRQRTRASVISLEEGVMEHWHHGRICLLGDAVHKVHPNLALGGNSAIEGVASFMNNLCRVMKTTYSGTKPSGTALNMVFVAYQKEQRQRIKELMDLSHMAAKMHTYATPLHRLLANWVFPLCDDRMLANHVGAYFAAAPKLDFLPCVGFPSGLLAWAEDGRNDDPRNHYINGHLNVNGYATGHVVY